jgi:hypothetical protein
MVNDIGTIDHSVPHREIKVPDDFTEQIEKQPFTHIGGKAVLGMGTWMKSFTYQFVPKEYDSFFFLNMLSVHPHYRG